MYIVISKPKRMSLAAGFSHFMQFLLMSIPQGAVRVPAAYLPTQKNCALFLKFLKLGKTLMGPFRFALLDLRSGNAVCRGNHAGATTNSMWRQHEPAPKR
jgi:hypothetical protein